MATATLNEIKIGQSFQTEFFTFGTMVSVVRVAYLTNHLEPISLDYKGEPMMNDSGNTLIKLKLRVK